MKKTLLSLIMLCLAALSGQSHDLKAGYRGFIEASWAIYDRSLPDLTWNENYYGISTVHGYQVDSHFFIGAGFELGRNAYLSSWYVPVFVDFRADMQLGKFTPFADCRVGWTFGNDGRARFQPMVGYRFRLGRKAGFNVGVGCTIQCYRLREAGYYDNIYGPGNGAYGVVTSTETVAGFCARIGFDF